MRRAVLTAHRVRGPLYRLAAVVLVGHFALSLALTDGVPGAVGGPLVVAALLTVALCVALTFLAPRLLPRDVPERVVAAPVRGRWTALNSPASAVPSHGVRAYGQAYAIDLVHEPEPGARPEFGTGRAMRPAAEYPAFGTPVHAMIDGVVVRVRQGRRDHRARSSLLGFAYLMVESTVREIGGVGNILGNHVTVRGDDGVLATVAHLQRGSARVRVGQRVGAGEVIGRCGNSGNSSEPHVHAQLMDRENPVLAQGLPMAFADVALGDDPTPVAGLPVNGEVMVAEHPRSTQ